MPVRPIATSLFLHAALLGVVVISAPPAPGLPAQGAWSGAFQPATEASTPLAEAPVPPLPSDLRPEEPPPADCLDPEPVVEASTEWTPPGPRPEPVLRAEIREPTHHAWLVQVMAVPTAPRNTAAPAPSPAQEGAFVPATAEASANQPPPYPAAARRLGQQGTVLLEVAIDATGSVTAVQVVRSCGHPLLDAAARRAVACWRYAPATRAGLPVPSTLDQPVVFTLQGDQALRGSRPDPSRTAPPRGH